MWASIGRILFFVLLANVAWAQYFPMNTQTTNNLQFSNPAYAGFSGKFNGFILSRNQWVGMDGAPNTQFFYVDGALQQKKMGWGLGIMNDAIGFQNFQQISASYSYRINLKSGKLSMGLNGGILHQGIEGKLLQLENENDPSFNNSQYSLFRPQFGFGLYYENQKLAIGVGVPWLLKGSDQNFTTDLHIFSNIAYLAHITDNVIFKPALQLKFQPGLTWQFDLVSNFIFWDRLWLTGGLRRGEGYFTGMRINIGKSIWIGYSFDRMIGHIIGYGGYNTHEVFISFNIHHKNLNQRSPRYF